jgi:predicted Zn-ribbon and HTH transcriptional regulator
MDRNLAFGGERLLSEVKKCPKCSGEMVQGEFLKNLPKIVVFSKEGRRSLDRVIPNYCKKCGFMEIYKEMK